MLKRCFKKVMSLMLLFLVLSQFLFIIIDNDKFKKYMNISNAAVFIDGPEYFVWDKKIIPNEEGTGDFTLLLESYYYMSIDAMGDCCEVVPEDYIIIVDQSAAMTNSFDTTTIQDAVSKKLKSLIDAVQDRSSEYGPKNRIAIVGVGGYDSQTNTYPDTEILIGNERYNYSELTDSLYKEALQSVDNYTTITNLKKNVESMKANGQLYIDVGIEIAEKIFERTYIDNELRNRKVILILGNSVIGNGWGNAEYLSGGNDGNSVANKSLDSMYRIKNDYKAHVNAVGLYSEVSASIPLAQVDWSDGVTNNTSKTDNFIHYLTDHYRYAKSLSNLGEETFTIKNGYYTYQFMSPKNLNTLENTLINTFRFSDNFLKTAEYNYTTMIDYIEPDFKIPDTISSDDIKVYCVDLTEGVEGEKYLYQDIEYDDIELSVEIKEKDGLDVVEVSGINYFEYCNWDNEYGSKIFVEVPIEIRDDASPGNQKDTNGLDSGFYFETNDNELKWLHKFNSPQVDVPAKVSINHINENDDHNAEITIVSNYSKVTSYEDVYEDGYYLSAVGTDENNKSILKNNASEIINGVMLDSEYTITKNDDSNYEITKVMVKEENGSEYELEYNDGYSLTITDNTDITVYTKQNGRTISVSKQWDDINNEDGIRPESVNVEIYQDEVLYDTVEIKNDSNWLYEFFVEDFDKTYTFKEININENYYLKNVEEVSSNNYVLTNNKYGSILINKKGSVLGNKLQGAIFNIERKNEDSTWSEVEQIETNEEGIAQLDKLIHGTYRITEEKAPDGYNLEKDRNVTEIEINSSKLDYELTILNRPQTILPETGDNGLLIIISIIFILLMIRRKYMGPLIVTQRVKNARINKNIRSNKKFKFIFNIDGKVKRKHSRKKARISYKNKRS